MEMGSARRHGRNRHQMKQAGCCRRGSSDLRRSCDGPHLSAREHPPANIGIRAITLAHFARHHLALPISTSASRSADPNRIEGRSCSHSAAPRLMPMPRGLCRSRYDRNAGTATARRLFLQVWSASRQVLFSKGHCGARCGPPVCHHAGIKRLVAVLPPCRSRRTRRAMSGLRRSPSPLQG